VPKLRKPPTKCVSPAEMLPFRTFFLPAQAKMFGNAHENAQRALVKTGFYRLLMVVITVLVAYIFTGKVTDAVNIGLVANVVKTGTYYGYERLWARIEWGRKDPS
jgi:uncharacterized membrane protein